MAKYIRVAAVQHAASANLDANRQASEQGIRAARAQGAQVVLLPELHQNLYFCQTESVECFELAESIPGHTTDWLGNLASELQIVIVGSVFERRAAGLYHNTAVVLEKNGQLAGFYRKMHIPDDPGFYEKFYFTPGDIPGFQPIATSAGKLGVFVCWDQWYPEAARLMTLAGAELLLYPTAIGWDPGDDAVEQQRQREAWITIQRAHAIANGLPVLSCNRCGFEADPAGGRGITFWGSSFIAGQQGEILAQAEVDSVTVVVAEIDLHRTETIRRIWPFLRDRRIDAYQGLLARYRDG